jgi:hypothetical protein
MRQNAPRESSSSRNDMIRMVRQNHLQIMALFQAYLNSPADSRQGIQVQILHQLASHLDSEKDLLFQKILNLGLQGQRMVREAEVEREGIKARILEFQYTEGDDDQARDEAFEDMMQSVQVLFMTEERDLLPLLARA